MEQLKWTWENNKAWLGNICLAKIEPRGSSWIGIVYGFENNAPSAATEEDLKTQIDKNITKFFARLAFEEPKPFKWRCGPRNGTCVIGAVILGNYVDLVDRFMGRCFLNEQVFYGLTDEQVALQIEDEIRTCSKQIYNQG